jgi:hypothetical protein
VVANGRVYVPTFSNQLDVYGLLCGHDITSQVSVTARLLSKQQTVTIRNTSGIAIDGPIQLALDDLSAGVLLANSSGLTGCAAPAGSPYVNVGLSGRWLGAGASVNVTLEFTNTGNARVQYKSRVLAGSGAR